MRSYFKETKGTSEKPPDSSIFVFGSTLRGEHVNGTSRYAKSHHGAKKGIGIGLVDRAYAIPTKTNNYANLSLDEVNEYVLEFIQFAEGHHNVDFFVTRIGCGRTGFIDAEIAPMFEGSPDNCRFSEMWRSWLD
jgi:hypothetical protein